MVSLRWPRPLCWACFWQVGTGWLGEPQFKGSGAYCSAFVKGHLLRFPCAISSIYVVRCSACHVIDPRWSLLRRFSDE